MVAAVAAATNNNLLTSPHPPSPDELGTEFEQMKTISYGDTLSVHGAISCSSPHPRRMRNHLLMVFVFTAMAAAEDFTL